MLRYIFFLAVVLLLLCMPSVAREAHPKEISRARADALVEAMTRKDPYIGTDPYPLEDDGYHKNFYMYQLVYREPRDPTQNAGYVDVNRRTGEIILVGGVECNRYPARPHDKPLQPGPGVELPDECN